MGIACWTPKAIVTHSQYVIVIDFPLQQWLHESASMLRCTYIACLIETQHGQLNKWTVNNGKGNTSDPLQHLAKK
jgi:hypothetical protein